jgi:hypothetical protein
MLRSKAIVAAFATALLAGCDVPPAGGEALDGVEAQKSELLAKLPLPITMAYGTQRSLGFVCGQACVDGYWVGEYGFVCTAWADDCSSSPIPQEVTLRQTSTSPEPMGAVENSWRPGCGRKATENILNYWGLPVSQDAISKAVFSFDFKFDLGITTVELSDQIATWPDDLRSGLQSLFNKYGEGTFNVQLKSTSYQSIWVEVVNEIQKGNAVLMLTKNGEHWVMVTGVRNGRWFYISDYHATGQWRQQDTLGLEIDGARSALGGWHGWSSNSYITINRTSTAVPAGSTSACQRAADVFGFTPTSTSGGSYPDAFGWWQSKTCKTWPRKTVCQGLSNQYGIAPAVTLLPGWCQEYPASCLGPREDWAPPEVQSWYYANECDTGPNTTNLCQRISDQYGTNAGVTWGFAPPEARTYWVNFGCNTRPAASNSCQSLSNLYGTAAWVTWAFAPQEARDYFAGVNCTTKPAYPGAPATWTVTDACRLAASTFDIVPNISWGAAPKYAKDFWAAAACR